MATGKYQLLGKLKPEHYAALEADIVARGVLVPIEVDSDGEILDGHNRVEIAERHGLICKSIARKFKTDAEKHEHVIKLNLARRHLETYEWGGLFKLLLKSRGIERDKRGPKAKDDNSGTVPELAAECGVDDDSTARARMRAHDAYLALPAKLRKQVDKGDLDLKGARAQVRKDKQLEKESAARPKSGGPKCKLTKDQEVVKCDAIITDPPYGILDEPWEPAKLEQFTRKWAKRWAKAEADSIIVFFSQAHMWNGRRWFDECLTGYEFQQLLVWHYANNKKPQSSKEFKRTWEPVFFYRRIGCEHQVGVGGGEWGKDLTNFDCHVAAVPQTNFTDAEFKQHPAQKPVSVMRWLVNAVTQPGQLVCDPFCGSGTTGIAALQLDRRFHGIDTDADFLKLSERRMAAYG